MFCIQCNVLPPATAALQWSGSGWRSYCALQPWQAVCIETCCLNATQTLQMFKNSTVQDCKQCSIKVLGTRTALPMPVVSSGRPRRPPFPFNGFVRLCQRQTNQQESSASSINMLLNSLETQSGSWCKAASAIAADKNIWLSATSTDRWVVKW